MELQNGQKRIILYIVIPDTTVKIILIEIRNNTNKQGVSE